ncbi:hypothetical protein [Dyadobacter sandarakinus]|uniref:Transporter n=1 Tax=Dyadobacter sandarakinus TaxID=2747268 RepID=A0ABX7I2J7_9BACT|nr:hypothetical protein [Dyadobacter sandarakinus]QRR00010.1 hypothetical protein HWI92_03280 [Dyadobacter sandarakinus]
MVNALCNYFLSILTPSNSLLVACCVFLLYISILIWKGKLNAEELGNWFQIGISSYSITGSMRVICLTYLEICKINEGGIDLVYTIFGSLAVVWLSTFNIFKKFKLAY